MLTLPQVAYESDLPGGAHVSFRQVAFAFPPPDSGSGPYERVFGVVPGFDAEETVIGIDPAVLDMPLPQANEHTAALALAQCRDLPARRRARTGLAGTFYRALLAEVREHLAEELLITAGMPVEHIARRLGYVEVSSFSQAFRRWKGVGPREYRKQHPAPNW